MATTALALVVAPSYSRDALSGPLRALCELLHQVKTGAFDPDSTRSGRWLQASATATVQDDSGGTKESAPESSSESSSESCHSSDTAQEEQVLLGTSHLLSLIASSQDFGLSLNSKTGVLHVLRHASDLSCCSN